MPLCLLCMQNTTRPCMNIKHVERFPLLITYSTCCRCSYTWSEHANFIHMIMSGQNLRLREKSPRYLRLWVFKSSFDVFEFAKYSQNFKVKEVSISSTFLARIFRTKVTFWQLFIVKKALSYKKTREKCWWNWHLVFYLTKT